jgi:NAD(P)-dependent dehydrogenase (short-subunit alcohol dehydrogenase family)
VPLLSSKVVLVSGGTQGVGAGVARAAVREGAAAVALLGRNRERGRALVAELTGTGAAAGTAVSFVPTDVADPAAVLASVDAVLTAHGKVDCLVNAAGLTSRGTLLDTTPELFDAHVAVNLRGPFFLMQAVVRSLVERGAPGQHRRRDLVLGAGRPALPRPVRCGEGGPGRADPQRRVRASVRPDPDQRRGHRLDRHRG